MKKILTLVIVLGALLGVAWYKSNERNSRLNRSTGTTKHRKLLIEDFDINGIKKLRIKEDKQAKLELPSAGYQKVVDAGNNQLLVTIDLQAPRRATSAELSTTVQCQG